MSISTEKVKEIFEELNGAKYVKTVETKDGEIIGIIVWHGGHQLTFISPYGDEDIANVGDFYYPTISEEEARKYVNEWASEIIKEWENPEEEEE